MGSPVWNLLNCTPALLVGKWAGSWSVLVAAKGSLWGPQLPGGPRWLHLVELWEIYGLSSPATWIFQSTCLEPSRFFASGLDVSDNLLFRILYKFYLLCFLLHALPFTKKNFSTSQSSFLMMIIPFPLCFKNTPRFLLAFEMSFIKNPPIYAHFHN